jgi:hypothetical protein
MVDITNGQTPWWVSVDGLGGRASESLRLGGSILPRSARNSFLVARHGNPDINCPGCTIRESSSLN